MKKTHYIIILVLIAAGLIWFGFLKGGYSWSSKVNGNGEVNPSFTFLNATADLIRVDLPYPGAVVGKKFSVLGKARGNWYFEASFPVQVLDKDGNVLAAIPAQAQGDWMTTDFVAFKADLSVPESYIGPATIVLKKDNPSGELSREASISFPVTIEY